MKELIQLKNIQIEDEYITLTYTELVGENSKAVCVLDILAEEYYNVSSNEDIIKLITMKTRTKINLWEAFKIYWKANTPFYQLVWAFFIAFTLVSILGSAPLPIWIALAVILSAIVIGSFFNVKKIKKRYNKGVL